MDLTDNLLFVCVVGFLITAVFAIAAWFALCAVGTTIALAWALLYSSVLEPLFSTIFSTICQFLDRHPGVVKALYSVFGVVAALIFLRYFLCFLLAAGVWALGNLFASNDRAKL